MDPQLIATAITEAPAWALISLTMPDEQMRLSGADELARWIARRLDQRPSSDPRQIGLPF